MPLHPHFFCVGSSPCRLASAIVRCIDCGLSRSRTLRSVTLLSGSTACKTILAVIGSIPSSGFDTCDR